ncbi:hypothetical protein P775_12595 [Puniceibacterium antarcticum]|uniref:Methyl-accepting chemotaxis protein n=2 Tax=Puniceibacterium antarcticum TaxID=1206336 RepID=A0A2G8RE65_9RHOB|nr:hypothetical protein P775_12595 [Puniceibacterium antarcticum]
MGAVALPLVLTVGVGFIAIESFDASREAGRWVNHTQEVLSEAQTILTAAVDMETGMRGYLLSGLENFLEPYDAGNALSSVKFSALKETVSDNPRQVARLAEAETVLGQWVSQVAEPEIEVRRVIGNSTTMTDLAREVRKGKGKAYFDAFRGKIATFIENEQALLIDRSAEFRSVIQSSEVESAEVLSTVAMVDHTHEVIETAQRILASAIDMETGMRGFLLAGDEAFLEPLNSGRTGFLNLVKELSVTVSDNPAQVALLAEIQEVIDSWFQDVVTPFIDMRRTIGNALTMDDLARTVGEARGKVFFDKFRETMAAFSTEEKELLKLRQNANAAATLRSENDILIMIAITILLGGSAGMLIGSSLSRGIKSLTTSMKDLAAGNHDLEIEGRSQKDEVGEMANTLAIFQKALIDKAAMEHEQRIRDEKQRFAVETLSEVLSALSGGDLEAEIGPDFPEEYQKIATDFNKTAATLRATILRVIAATESIRSGSSEISQASEDLSKRTETQAATLEETAAALEELTTSVKRTSDGARNVETLMKEARTEAEVGGSVVRQAVSAMNEIQESSNQVAQIIKVIEDIAFQVNLLALNAGVEAARAGEAGKGFAVVASEVRNLSIKCAEAAKEIQHRIRRSTDQVEGGVKLVAKTGDSLDAIIKRVQDISQHISHIAQAATEQSVGLGEINTGVSDLDRVAQHNAAMVEQSTAASHQLMGEANELSDSVKHFKIDLSRETVTSLSSDKSDRSSRKYSEAA